MFVFLLILILLAVLGVLGLALKIAAALILGIVIAVTAVAVAGYWMIRRQMRRMESAMRDAGASNGRIADTTVDVGRPRQTPANPSAGGVDDRY